VFAFRAILVLAGRAAHLEAVVRPQRTKSIHHYANSAGPLARPRSLCCKKAQGPGRRFGDLVSPTVEGLRAPGPEFLAPNNSMEPTWPAESRCRRSLIDSGLPVLVCYLGAKS